MTSLTKLVSTEFLIGTAISAAVSLASITAWKTETTAEVESLRKEVEISRRDHDAIIRLEEGVRYVSKSVDEIKKHLQVK